MSHNKVVFTLTHTHWVLGKETISSRNFVVSPRAMNAEKFAIFSFSSDWAIKWYIKEAKLSLQTWVQLDQSDVTSGTRNRNTHTQKTIINTVKGCFSVFFFWLCCIPHHCTNSTFSRWNEILYRPKCAENVHFCLNCEKKNYCIFSYRISVCVHGTKCTSKQ